MCQLVVSKGEHYIGSGIICFLSDRVLLLEGSICFFKDGLVDLFLPLLKCETVSSSILWTTLSSRMKSALNERICSGSRSNFFQHRRRKVENIGSQKVCVGTLSWLETDQRASVPPSTHPPTHPLLFAAKTLEYCILSTFKVSGSGYFKFVPQMFLLNSFH